MGGSSGSPISTSDSQQLEQTAKKILTGSPESPHVFISFAMENENAVNLIRGQAKNPQTDLQFDDFSLKDAIKSNNEDYIKRKIRERIKRASVTAVYLTPDSANSKWVSWEIQETLRQGKSVVGVYPGDKPPSNLPAAFNAHGLPVVKWSHQALTDGIAKARTSD